MIGPPPPARADGDTGRGRGADRAATRDLQPRRHPAPRHPPRRPNGSRRRSPRPRPRSPSHPPRPTTRRPRPSRPHPPPPDVPPAGPVVSTDPGGGDGSCRRPDARWHRRRVAGGRRAAQPPARGQAAHPDLPTGRARRGHRDPRLPRGKGFLKRRRRAQAVGHRGRHRRGHSAGRSASAASSPTSRSRRCRPRDDLVAEARRIFAEDLVDVGEVN